MKLLLQKEEEREKVKKKEWLEEEDPKAREGEDGPGDNRGRRSPPCGYRGGFHGADI